MRSFPKGETSVLVLDIETRPDPFARRIASRGGVSASRALWEICCVSLLRFELSADATVVAAELDTFHADDFDEADIVENIELNCRAVLAEAGWLMTYDGERHDLPVIRSRQVRWWRPHRRGIMQLAANHHLDVGLWAAGRPGKVPALRDGCASVGVSIQPIVKVGGTPAPVEAAKSELDVSGTAILGLYALADLRRSVSPLINGLPSLGGHFKRFAEGRPHLEGLALNPVLSQPAGPWGHLAPRTAWVTRQKQLPARILAGCGRKNGKD